MLVAVVVCIVGALSSPVAILLSASLDDVVQPEILASAYGVVVVAAVGGAAFGTSVAGLIVGGPTGITGAAVMSSTAVASAVALAIPRIQRPTTSH